VNGFIQSESGLLWNWQSVGRSVGLSVSQSVSQPVSQSVSQSDSQSLSPSVSQSISPSISQSVSQPASQPASSSVSQSASHPVSQSVNQSISQSVHLSILPLWDSWPDFGCSQESCGFVCRGASSLTGGGVCHVTSQSLCLYWWYICTFSTCEHEFKGTYLPLQCCYGHQPSNHYDTPY
jgi:hypothetical protein